MLEEMEESQINVTLRNALDSQMTEFTLDIKMLIEDAREKIDEYIKATEDWLDNLLASPLTQPRLPTNSYASVLVNPPPHANPRIVAREGIKARQFLVQGLKESKFSHFDIQQLKAEFNKFLIELGLSSGKIWSVVNTWSGSTVLEADSDEATTWLANTANQWRFCDKIGSNAKFQSRNYNIIAFNVPLAINPKQDSHCLEICEANDLEPNTII